MSTINDVFKALPAEIQGVVASYLEKPDALRPEFAKATQHAFVQRLERFESYPQKSLIGRCFARGKKGSKSRCATFDKTNSLIERSIRTTRWCLKGAEKDFRFDVFEDVDRLRLDQINQLDDAIARKNDLILIDFIDRHLPEFGLGLGARAQDDLERILRGEKNPHDKAAEIREWIDRRLRSTGEEFLTVPFEKRENELLPIELLKFAPKRLTPENMEYYLAHLKAYLANSRDPENVDLRLKFWERLKNQFRGADGAAQLLALGAETTIEKMQKSLQMETLLKACSTGQIDLLKLGCEELPLTQDQILKLCEQAGKFSNRRVIRYLLSLPSRDLKEKYSRICVITMESAKSGHREIVDWFLKEYSLKGASSSVTDVRGAAVLGSLEGKHIERAKKLFREGSISVLSRVIAAGGCIQLERNDLLKEFLAAPIASSEARELIGILFAYSILQANLGAYEYLLDHFIDCLTKKYVKSVLSSVLERNDAIGVRALRLLLERKQISNRLLADTLVRSEQWLIINSELKDLILDHLSDEDIGQTLVRAASERDFIAVGERLNLIDGLPAHYLKQIISHAKVDVPNESEDERDIRNFVLESLESRRLNSPLWRLTGVPGMTNQQLKRHSIPVLLGGAVGWAIAQGINLIFSTDHPSIVDP